MERWFAQIFHGSNADFTQKKFRMKKYFQLFALAALSLGHETANAQNFYFGADLSYVNEMEDCGVTYHENGAAKDVYQIFHDNGCNLVRLRLWHTPSWYDTLNSGKRYSNFADVKKAIARAKAQQMKVLLDFHLSDTWADPNRQLCPAAWLGVVDNLPLLKDSLYNYVSGALLQLNAAGLLPDMVQIGNETNRGIMLSPAVDAAGWSLDWNRNSELFKRAIQAVRDVQSQTGKSIKVALHIAGPADVAWLMQGFWSHGVTDFDVIGISYYWAWHMPTSIADAGNVVAQMRQLYPGKEVMIFETGYIWTTDSNDNAANIINAVNPDYAPASPENQRKWLVDMTQEVINKGASGVIYWEPAWVSSTCWTPWGQGSHQENATFFDFQNNLLNNGGVGWMTHQYAGLASKTPEKPTFELNITADHAHNLLNVSVDGLTGHNRVTIRLVAADGKQMEADKTMEVINGKGLTNISLPSLKPGLYYAIVADGNLVLGYRGFGFFRG